MVDWGNIILTRADKESNLCIEVGLTAWDKNKKRGVHTWFKEKRKPRIYKKDDLIYVCGPKTVLTYMPFPFERESFEPNAPNEMECKIMGILLDFLRHNTKKEEGIDLLVLSDVETEWLDFNEFGAGTTGIYAASYTGFKLPD